MNFCDIILSFKQGISNPESEGMYKEINVKGKKNIICSLEFTQTSLRKDLIHPNKALFV
jgi:hypothetical protein